MDVTPTPTALAWDGTNLYVTDPTDRRILVFFPGDIPIPLNAVRNAASREIFEHSAPTYEPHIRIGIANRVSLFDAHSKMRSKSNNLMLGLL